MDWIIAAFVAVLLWLVLDTLEIRRLNRKVADLERFGRPWLNEQEVDALVVSHAAQQTTRKCGTCGVIWLGDSTGQGHICTEEQRSMPKDAVI